MAELGRARAGLWGRAGAARRPKEAGGWRCHSCQEDTHSIPWVSALPLRAALSYGQDRARCSWELVVISLTAVQ